MGLHNLIKRALKVQNILNAALGGLVYDTQGLYREHLSISISKNDEVIVHIKDECPCGATIKGGEWFTIIKATYNDSAFELTHGEDLVLYWNDGMAKTWQKSFLNTLNDELPNICTINTNSKVGA